MTAETVVTRLVRVGLAPTDTAAVALIVAGAVQVEGVVVRSSSHQVERCDVVEISASAP